MGVFEELLKRKVIKEDEDGNVSLTKRETKPIERPNIQEQEDKISTYNGIKRMAMREEGETLRRASELRRQEIERINAEARRQNDAFNTSYPQGVALPTASQQQNPYSFRDEKQKEVESKRKSALERAKILTQEEKDKFVKTGELGKGELFKATNGAVDDRSNAQKIVDNVIAPIANVGIGIESTVPSIVNYGNAALGKLSRVGLGALARNFTDRETANNIGDIAGNVIYNKATRELQNDLAGEKEWRDKTTQYNINRTTNVGSKKLAELAPSLGQNMVPMAVAALPVPGARALSTAMFMTSAAGNYLDDAKERGMNDDQALGYATIMGLAEGGSESLVSGNMVSRVKKAFTGKALSETFLNSLGTELTENFAQEASMEPFQELMAQTIGGEKAANWDNIEQRTLQAGFDGILSALLLKGTSMGIVSSQNVMSKIENNQTITDSDISNMINDLKRYDRTGYEQTVQGAVEAIKQQMQKGTALEQQLINQQNNVAQNPTSQEIDITPVVNEQNRYTNNLKEQARSFEDILDEAMDNMEYDEVSSPLDNRDIKTIGQARNVNAYQYDNPEVKPYFREMAQMLGEDVSNISSAENRRTQKGGGTSLTTTVPAVTQLHDDMGYSYNQILDGIQNIVNDNGKENNALSKKIEIIIDEQLRNGYRNSYGRIVDPNQDYINLITGNTANEVLARASEVSQNNIAPTAQDALPTQNKQTQNSTEDLKQQQLDIIKENNAMTDDYHTGIRDINDIKTFDEVIDDDESFVYGDFSREDAQKALKDGKVTVYSSKPIEQGSFVSTSQNMARDYAGSGQIYSQEVDLNDVAWINGDEGQYAKINDNNVNDQIQKSDKEEYENIMQKSENEIRQDVNTTIDNIYKGTLPNKNQILMKEMPKTIQNLGVNNSPLLATPTTIRNSVLTSTEAEKLGYSLKNNNYHGLGKNGFNNVLDDLYSPVMVIRENPKKIVVFTEEFDYKNKQVIVPIEINSESYFNTLKIKANVALSAHGRSSVYNYINKLLNNSSQIIYKNKEKIQKLLDGRKVQYPESISSVSNLIVPSSNENVNSTYSMQNNENNTQNAAPTADNNVAERARPERSINYDVQSEKQNTPGESINWNEMQRPEGKFRKHYRSIIESSNTTAEAKAIAKELMGLDTYEADSNANQLERADAFIEKYGIEKALERLEEHVESDSVAYDGVFKKVGVDDIALGERLIQYYSKTGDAINLQNAIRLTATAGTYAGRMVQAFNILNHQTPTGQVAWIQRSVDKMNKELQQKRGKNAEQFDFTPEMQQKIMDTNTQEEMYDAINEVYEELGQQVSKTTTQKIDAWRYFSMLANPKTHIRNIVGNVAMGKVQTVKNKVAGVIEGTVSKFNPDMERTHTIVPASKEVKQFAKLDLQNLEVQTGLELNENKYNPKSRLENSMRTFKHDAFENTIGKLFEFNNKALEVEDAWGLKSAYVKSLSEYMTANKLNPENITDSQLAKARKYAIEQAKEATFHQASALASAINQFSNKNGLTKFAMDAVVPFKKTPINVAKAGMEYSPVGLAKSAIYDTVQLRKGNITVNQYIDNVSKGLTGTGVALLGYALASAGILKASGTDDKDKESYDQDRGKQTYSIQIGDNTYSLDWLAPTGIPLFIGAEVHEIMQQEKESKSSSSDEDSVYNQALNSAMNIVNSLTNAVDPMTEMSMLSGLTSTLKSYDNNLFSGMAINMGKSYVNQFVPTALGQIAKTTDEYQRSTTSTKKGTLPKAIDSTKNQIMAKIPGLRQMLPTKTDIWGNEQKQSENILQRGLENAVFPWTRKGISTNNVDRELETLYKDTGESSVLPDSINRDLTIDKQKYVMTSEEYARYKKQYGEDSYKILNNLVSSSQYKKMNDSQKQKAIEKVYEYAKEQIKIDYAKNNKLTYDDNNLSKTVNSLKKANANVSNYFEYIASTQDTTKTSEKLEKLTNSNYSKKTKQIIYENSLLEADDEKYPIIKNTGLDIDSYLKYKIAASNGEFAADIKNSNIEKARNNTVTGSGSKKAYNYIMNMQGATYMQKIILYGLSYSPKETDKQAIANYIVNMEGKTYEERKEMLKKFSWITIYNDGSYDI